MLLTATSMRQIAELHNRSGSSQKALRFILARLHWFPLVVIVGSSTMTSGTTFTIDSQLSLIDVDGVINLILRTMHSNEVIPGETEVIRNPWHWDRSVSRSDRQNRGSS